MVSGLQIFLGFSPEFFHLHFVYKTLHTCENGGSGEGVGGVMPKSYWLITTSWLSVYELMMEKWQTSVRSQIQLHRSVWGGDEGEVTQAFNWKTPKLKIPLTMKKYVFFYLKTRIFLLQHTSSSRIWRSSKLQSSIFKSLGS